MLNPKEILKSRGGISITGSILAGGLSARGAMSTLFKGMVMFLKGNVSNAIMSLNY
jgi:hypothetical protein